MPELKFNDDPMFAATGDSKNLAAMTTFGLHQHVPGGADPSGKASMT